MEQQADGYTRPASSPLAQPIRESAMRAARRAVGPDGVRWLEALVRLEIGLNPGEELAALAPLHLDRITSRALAAMDALSEAECEALAQRYGL